MMVSFRFHLCIWKEEKGFVSPLKALRRGSERENITINNANKIEEGSNASPFLLETRAPTAWTWFYELPQPDLLPLLALPWVLSREGKN